MRNILSPEHIASLIDRAWDVTVVFVPRLLAAVLILLIAALIARRVATGISRLMERTGHIDATLRVVVSQTLRYAVIVLALVAALEQIGIKATSVLAVLGAAGLAIGLALQGTLSNIAAGVMLLWLRPFRIGDYIEVNNVPGLSGTVRSMGLFTCELEAYDGLFLFVPNSGLWNVPLRNFSRNADRLVAWTITLPLSIHPEKACAALNKLAQQDDRVLKSPPPVAFIDKITADSHLLDFRVWTQPSQAGALQRDMPDRMRAAIVEGLEQPPAVQITRIVPPDHDPSRLTDAGTITEASPRHHHFFR